MKPQIPGRDSGRSSKAVQAAKTLTYRMMTGGRRGLGVSPITAARFVGCLATLRECCVPEIALHPEIKLHDPKLSRLLLEIAGDPNLEPQHPDARGKLGDVLDRLFLLDEQLEVDTTQVVNRRVLALDIGEVGIMMAFDAARQAFEEARIRPGAPPSREAFLRALAAKLGVALSGCSRDEVKEVPTR